MICEHSAVRWLYQSSVRLQHCAERGGSHCPLGEHVPCAPTRCHFDLSSGHLVATDTGQVGKLEQKHREAKGALDEELRIFEVGCAMFPCRAPKHHADTSPCHFSGPHT